MFPLGALSIGMTVYNHNRPNRRLLIPYLYTFFLLTDTLHAQSTVFVIVFIVELHNPNFRINYRKKIRRYYVGMYKYP